MIIDKEKLKLGIWYEDREGNVYKKADDDYTVGKPKEDIYSYHVCFPTEIVERIDFYYDKDNCKHPLKYRKRTHGWIKGIKGCICKKCGKTKTGKSHIPFAFMNWDEGCDTYTGFISRKNLGKDSLTDDDWKKVLNRCLGDDSWEDDLYFESTQLNLFQDVEYEKASVKDIQRFICKKMKEGTNT